MKVKKWGLLIREIDTFIHFNLIQRKQLALLDLLIAASQEGLLTDIDVKEEIDAFMFAVCICKFF